MTTLQKFSKLSEAIVSFIKWGIVKIAFINVKNCWLVFGPVKERIGLKCCSKCCKM